VASPTRVPTALVRASPSSSARASSPPSQTLSSGSRVLILVSDDRQLPEAGGLFRTLANGRPSAKLTDNMRQEDEWERAALSSSETDHSTSRLTRTDSSGRPRVSGTLQHDGCPPKPRHRRQPGSGDWDGDGDDTVGVVR